MHAAFESRLVSIPSAAGRLRELYTYILTLTDDAIDALGGNAAVDAYAQQLYDKYLLPLDAPGPDLIVDNAAKRVLSFLIHAVDDEK